MDDYKRAIIGFDAKRIVRNATGLGNYGRTLVNSLVSISQDQYKYLLYAPDKGRDNLRNQIQNNDAIDFVYPRDKYFRFEKDLWRVKDIVKDMKQDDVKIYHGLSGELPMGLNKSGIHGIVTIHDLIFLRFPQLYNWFDTKIYSWKFHLACREAERIIAISECTKRDIVEFGHVNPDKIKVIYQGCDNRFKQRVSEEKKHQVKLYYGLPERYILNVGSIEERKNIILAIKALTRLPDYISLVIVGKHTSYTNKVIDYIEKNNLYKRILIINDMPLADLPATYQMAEAFVYPSRYEGFGIPIIEAIHSGLPVVACTGSCLEEAGGKDNIYVSPDDDEALADALNKSLLGAEGRNERILHSQEYVKKFDNAHAAQEILEEYQSFT